MLLVDECTHNLCEKMLYELVCSTCSLSSCSGEPFLWFHFDLAIEHNLFPKGKISRHVECSKVQVRDFGREKKKKAMSQRIIQFSRSNLLVFSKIHFYIHGGNPKRVIGLLVYITIIAYYKIHVLWIYYYILLQRYITLHFTTTMLNQKTASFLCHSVIIL